MKKEAWVSSQIYKDVNLLLGTQRERHPGLVVRPHHLPGSVKGAVIWIHKTQNQ